MNDIGISDIVNDAVDPDIHGVVIILFINLFSFIGFICLVT